MTVTFFLQIHYAGQAIGLIVASTPETARYAATKVRVTYKDEQRPVLSIREAVRIREEAIAKAVKEGKGEAEAKAGEEPVLAFGSCDLYEVKDPGNA